MSDTPETTRCGDKSKSYFGRDPFGCTRRAGHPGVHTDGEVWWGFGVMAGWKEKIAMEDRLFELESQLDALREAPTNGISLIADERRRQVEVENWTAQHDDEHTRGEMAIAAACYAWPAPRPLEVKKAWPWHREWWKPAVSLSTSPEEARNCRVKDLVRAGALIAAEIDRLYRASRSSPPSEKDND